MLTLEKILAAHTKVKSGADFPAYIRDLKGLGVQSYSTFVSDGHTSFLADSGEQLTSASKYTELNIAEQSSPDQFLNELREHQQGKTNYAEFCAACAANGIEYWQVDITAMTCTYYDKAGAEILQEQIPA